MRTRTGCSLALFFLLGACRGPLIQGTGSGARIRTEGPYTERVRELVAEYEEQVIEVLGTRYDREFVIEILPEDGELDGETHRRSRRVRIGKLAVATDETLTRTVIHELVHVHSVGLWREAPAMLEEGFAYVITAILMDDLERFSRGLPTVNEYLEILTLDYVNDYQNASPERFSELTRGAARLAYEILRNSSAERFSEAKWRPTLERVQMTEQWQDGLMLLKPKVQRQP
jgi:hypothetical protein